MTTESAFGNSLVDLPLNTVPTYRWVPYPPWSDIDRFLRCKSAIAPSANNTEVQVIQALSILSCIASLISPESRKVGSILGPQSSCHAVLVKEYWQWQVNGEQASFAHRRWGADILRDLASPWQDSTYDATQTLIKKEKRRNLFTEERSGAHILVFGAGYKYVAARCNTCILRFAPMVGTTPPFDTEAGRRRHLDHMTLYCKTSCSRGRHPECFQTELETHWHRLAASVVGLQRCHFNCRSPMTRTTVRAQGGLSVRQHSTHQSSYQRTATRAGLPMRRIMLHNLKTG